MGQVDTCILYTTGTHHVCVNTTIKLMDYKGYSTMQSHGERKSNMGVDEDNAKF